MRKILGVFLFFVFVSADAAWLFGSALGLLGGIRGGRKGNQS
jgi:hypothetical protein